MAHIDEQLRVLQGARPSAMETEPQPEEAEEEGEETVAGGRRKGRDRRGGDPLGDIRIPKKKKRRKER